MASLFGHVAASAALGYAFFPRQVRPATLLLTGFCAFAPDLDVLGFRFGIPYESEWGHRGWTHSLAFAAIFGSLMAWAFLRHGSDFRKILCWCVLATILHPLLDMMTNGGRGCALWWPFSVERLFFPFRPIQVSPMTVRGFLSEWGLTVLASEAVWIGLPCLAIVVLARRLRRMTTFV